ncbi:MAG TPA: hypothetical protein VI731_10015 [Bacteroidia bacterium]|nr:hypothetical protein [Bacteroidia bacterium]
MKVLIALLILTVLFTGNPEKYIAEIIPSKTSIKITFQDSSSNEFALHQDQYRYFFLEKNKIYLEYDSMPHAFLSIDSILNANAVRPSSYYDAGVNSMFLVFVIDVEGKTLYKGFDRDAIANEEWEVLFNNIMKRCITEFIPAKVKSKNVGSIYRMCFTYDPSQNVFVRLNPKMD